MRLVTNAIQFYLVTMKGKETQKIEMCIVYASESKLLELTKLLNLTNDSITSKIH